MYVYGLEKQLNKKRLFLYNDIYGNNDDEKTNCEIDEIIGNTRDLERMKLKDSIFGLMDFLKGYCNITGAYMVFKSLMENGGDRKGTCAELGITAGRVSQIVKEIRSTGYYVREFLN